MRYCVEVFFLAVDSYCELIYIVKAEQEFNYKNIFINKEKVSRSKKAVLLYLLQIDGQHSLFTSFSHNIEAAEIAKDEDNN